MTGHVHARFQADAPGPSTSPRVKRRIRSKISLAELERQERGRSRIPEVPRLRTLARDPADVPISEDSSATDRAASDRGLNESVETVPILRSNSSPSIIQNPSQVMSPNLVAGSALNATPSGSGMDTDPGVQAILQQWQEVKTEHGTVERTFTQCARAWPLASHVKLEGMESAIHILRQACDYLHEGKVKLGSITDQKCDTEKVQQAIAELMVTIQNLQTQGNEGSRRTGALASRIDEISGEAASWSI